MQLTWRTVKDVIGFKVAIPARMKAERLPGKPLMTIHGIPMVVHVALNCIDAVGVRNVVVLTPDPEIMNACSDAGIEYFRSKPSCRTGTDRLVEYAKDNQFELYFNVQGDEPMLSPHLISDFIRFGLSKPCNLIGVSRIFSKQTLGSPHTVKVVTSQGRILYASRTALASGDEASDPVYFRHAGIYSFLSESLMRFGNLPQGPLESFEKIEILRLLENGIEVYSYELPNYGRAVDFVEDYLFVKRFLRVQKNL